MGRKPTRWTNLPTGMRARPRGKKIHYYLDTGSKPRREIPLGSNYIMAVAKWAELTAKPVPVRGTFVEVWDKYKKLKLPDKAPRTQKDNLAEVEYLLRFFGNPPAPLDSIEPVHIRQYMRWRCGLAKKDAEAKNELRRKQGRPLMEIPANIGHVRANREKALFSHVWNFAREEGYTKQPNPCAGITGYREEGRDVYVDDDLMDRVMAVAGKPLQFALRLAEITGQRPADVLRMSEADIAGGFLNVKQGKTKAKLRIAIQGELATLLTEIQAYKKSHQVHALAILVSETGQPMTYNALRNRFDAARDRAGIDKGSFQFRDLRAKAATDADDVADIKTAQAMLGHTTEAMTAHYIRHRVGKKVKPIR
ncbi:integrase [Corticibacter populi]|uniref:Integrase n=1 Tax=Corticibacter populi TaxID=1550736 RepID=A0A3M6R007_9BURK|nr:tyrosine-type recombinase/integrase [Corticibacter populi]RMX08545.1 integrase [Corticibacter populi]RZS35862.1 phage integrase family protein [Corticibacter populi]